MDEDLVKWDSIGFSGIDANLNPQSVRIREIDVDNAYARLVIETNKTINLLNALRLTNTNAPATNETNLANSKPARTDARPTVAATNAPLPQIAIGAIVITNTTVSFTDRSISAEREPDHPVGEWQHRRPFHRATPARGHHFERDD